MLNFEKLAAKNGDFTQDCKRYVLLCSAYAENVKGDACYSAEAVSPDDKPDEDGFLPCYSVVWELADGFADYCVECNQDGAWIDESLACDWDNPVSVTELGMVSPDGRIV